MSWTVPYANGRYGDFAEFDNEDAAWRFYTEMNEEPDGWANEPEYDFSQYSDDEIAEMYCDLGAMGKERDCSEQYWQCLSAEYNERAEASKSWKEQYE